MMWNSSITSAPSYYGHQAQQLPTSAVQQPPSANTAAASAVAAASSSGQKHDIFVGNLAFATTEEQLYAAFSELGRIVKIRMVSDLETGKPRGFAFVEFEDPQAALSAIRNMNDYEINGRKLRVNFSNSSHLETLANQLGMDLSHVSGNKSKGGDAEDSNAESSGGMMGSAGGGMGGHAMAGGGMEGMMTAGIGGGGVAGSKAVASALKSMNKGEMYDVVAKLKEIADTNPDEARKLLTQHPQLPEAILYCMSELDMIKTPVGTTLGMGVSTLAPPATLAPPSLTTMAKPIDPRSQFSSVIPPPPSGVVAQTQQPPPPPITMAMPSDPRARPADPRAIAAAARDPRAAAAVGGAPPPNFPAPPPMMQHPPPSMPPPPIGMAPPPPQQPGSIVPSGVAGLDPNLVQQVMALTPAQIAQLPPDKQQSILALRQQITGGVLR